MYIISEIHNLASIYLKLTSIQETRSVSIAEWGKTEALNKKSFFRWKRISK